MFIFSSFPRNPSFTVSFSDYHHLSFFLMVLYVTVPLRHCPHQNVDYYFAFSLTPRFFLLSIVHLDLGWFLSFILGITMSLLHSSFCVSLPSHDGSCFVFYLSIFVAKRNSLSWFLAWSLRLNLIVLLSESIIWLIWSSSPVGLAALVVISVRKSS